MHRGLPDMGDGQHRMNFRTGSHGLQHSDYFSIFKKLPQYFFNHDPGLLEQLLWPFRTQTHPI